MVSLPRLIMVILLSIMKNVIFTLILSAMALMPVHADNKPSKLSAQALYAQFQNPDSRYRPFVRWWWNGDAVVGKELVRELHLLRDAGIGGVEINPISLPYGADQHGYKQLTWLSQPWLEALDTTLTEARRIGMTCDLLIGSGWPFGSETLPHKGRGQVSALRHGALRLLRIGHQRRSRSSRQHTRPHECGCRTPLSRQYVQYH